MLYNNRFRMYARKGGRTGEEDPIKKHPGPEVGVPKL